MTAQTRPRYDELPDMVTPAEAGAFLDVSRNTMYELLRTGTIRSVKYGRLIRIPKAALLEPTTVTAAALRVVGRRPAG
jgi:excisionase family DNA binding protein